MNENKTKQAFKKRRREMREREQIEDETKNETTAGR